ncbi:S8 family peptidase [Streptomyces cinereoruber]|uniref:S8 family peptidase n=1 Tax=Streptomyces cinereoruber TaxID=67260 RepID=UPI00363D068E
MSEKSPIATSKHKVDFRIAPKNGIKDSFLVGLPASVSESQVEGEARKLAAEYAGSVRHIYKKSVRGFAVNISEDNARKMAHDSRVKYVGQDVEGYTATQVNPPAHLDRIDQANRPLNNKYTGDIDLAGKRPDIYVIDGGINASHVAFDNRASIGNDFTPPERRADGSLVPRGVDCRGHGTHVAALASSTVYGVARGANIIAVKASNCQGVASASNTLAAVEWVRSNAVTSRSVVNMSLAFPFFESPQESSVGMLKLGIENSITAGLPYVVAAGNNSGSACSVVPAAITTAITVAAADASDSKPAFSNFGTCVDIFAPGLNITSASNTNNTGTTSLSGTSQASPQVAGAVAVIQALTPGQQSPFILAATLRAEATSGVLSNIGAGSPNRLLRVRSQ